MVLVIVKVELQTNRCLLPYRSSVDWLIVMFVFSSDSFHQNTRPINRPSSQTRVRIRFLCYFFLNFVGSGVQRIETREKSKVDLSFSPLEYCLQSLHVG